MTERECLQLILEAIEDERGLNEFSIVDTVWLDELTTLVDFINIRLEDLD